MRLGQASRVASSIQIFTAVFVAGPAGQLWSARQLEARWDGNKNVDVERDCLLDAIAAYAGDGTVMPNLDAANLAADALRERAKAECAPWWDTVHNGIKLAGLNLHGVRLSGADLTGASLGRST